MSTEQDLATIEAVTAKIAGPLKLRKLTIRGDGVDAVYLHYTVEGALASATADMEGGFTPALPHDEIGRHIAKLATDRRVFVRDTEYFITDAEVGP